MEMHSMDTETITKYSSNIRRPLSGNLFVLVVWVGYLYYSPSHSEKTFLSKGSPFDGMTDIAFPELVKLKIIPI